MHKRQTIIFRFFLLFLAIGTATGYFLFLHHQNNQDASSLDQNTNQPSDDPTSSVSSLNSKFYAAKRLAALYSAKFYTDTQPANLSLGNSIIVSKLYSLPADYEPENLVYVNDSQRLAADAAAAYEQLIAASEYNFVITSGYRSYTTQSNLYNNYLAANGFDWAETWSARPGYSEHQTGLAMDIVEVGTNFDTFGDTAACQWLKDNAHRFGFIHRYPEGKTSITGYSYESWHYRYLGVELATAIYDSGLTYDEYFALYLAE